MCDRTPSPTADILVEVLASPRQRFVLSYLHDNGGEATLTELSHQVALHETGRVTAVDRDTVQDVYIFLKRVHIPALEDRGFIRYDNRENVILLHESRLGGRSPAQMPSETERRWRGYYALVGLGLSGVVLAYVLQTIHLSRAVLTHSIVIAVLFALGVAGGRYYHSATATSD